MSIEPHAHVEPGVPVEHAGACTYCGNGYGPSDLVCPSCSFPTPMARTRATQDARRARLRTRVVVGVTALVVVGGSGFLLLRGEDRSQPGVLPGAPAGAPTQLEPSWDTTFDSRVLGELAVGDALVVSIDSGDLVALDAQGDPTWSTAQLDSPVVAIDARGEVLVSAGGGPGAGPGISAHALADGDELWRYPDITYVGVADSGIVVDVEAEGGPFGVLDARSGTPLWSVPDVDAYAVAGAMAFVRRGSDVTGLSAADGSVLWTVDVGAGPRATLVATPEVVVVLSGADVVGLDPLDGSELWTARARGAAVEVLSDELVLVTGARAQPPTAVAYDASGPRGELPASGGVPAGLVPFTVDGTSYAVDPVSGNLLGPDLSVLATYAGTVTPGRDGVFVVRGGRVAHYPLGSATPDSEVAVPGAGRVVVLEDGFAVVAGDTVTRVG